MTTKQIRILITILCVMAAFCAWIFTFDRYYDLLLEADRVLFWIVSGLFSIFPFLIIIIGLVLFIRIKKIGFWILIISLIHFLYRNVISYLGLQKFKSSFDINTTNRFMNSLITPHLDKILFTELLITLVLIILILIERKKLGFEINNKWIISIIGITLIIETGLLMI